MNKNDFDYDDMNADIDDNQNKNNNDENDENDKNVKWFCYILRNNHEPDRNRTYNGKTNNPIRRLREHNEDGIRNKGAKYTRTYGRSTWEFIVIIGGFESEVEALRHEWRIKKPEGKNRGSKYLSAEGRVKGLNYALGLERFTSKCEKPLAEMNLTIWILREYAHLLDDRPELHNLTIIECESLDTEYINQNIRN